MIPGRADGANDNDLVTVRRADASGHLPSVRWLKQTFGVWLGWGAVKRKTAPPAKNATQGARDAAAERAGVAPLFERGVGVSAATQHEVVLCC